jgi:fatty-acid desaturase
MNLQFLLDEIKGATKTFFSPVVWMWNWMNDPTNRKWTVVAASNLLGIIAVYFVVTEFAWWMLGAIWFMWLVFGGIGAEAGLHNLWSHTAFRLIGPVRYFVGWCAVMSAQETPFFWAMIHRGFHHPHSDREKDLHSPKRGWWTAYIGWMFGNLPLEGSLGYVRDLLRDPMLKCINKHYAKIYWISILFGFLILGKYAFVWFVIPSLLAAHQENMVNLFCHVKIPLLNYRNHDTPDNSYNNWLLALIAPWGVFLHNNHHNSPKRYHFDERWFEIDVRRWLVPALIWIDEGVR